MRMLKGEQGADFVRLLMQSERRIYAFIRSLIPHQADAEDVLQETSTVLWKKFEQFEPGGDFVAWAIRIARYEVAAFRRKQRREALFTDEFVELLARESEAQQEHLAGTQAALAHCLDLLPSKDRALLRDRYEPGVTVQSLADARRQPIQTVYSLLKRARKTLLVCVQRTLAAEERT